MAKAFGVLAFVCLSQLLFAQAFSTQSACLKHEDCHSHQRCQFSYSCDGSNCRDSGFCFDQKSTGDAELVSMIQTSEKSKNELPMAGMNVTAVSLTSPVGQPATVNLGAASTGFQVGVTSAGLFEIGQGQNAILDVQTNGLFTTSANIKTNGLSLGGFMSMGQTRQWRLVYAEDFSRPISGWSNSTTSECGGITMLGGYCIFSVGDVTKTYSNITTDHSSLRVVATFHFIDAWEGETGYMMMDIGRNGEMQYVWAEHYDQTQSTAGINICGNKHTESKFSAAIDVSVPHTSSSVTLGFGATLDQDPCDESFGISSVQIFVR
eukprot:GILJ01000390.1.p1 GENE.GILJ01000390.1~~GILJ01000390.1.p1  ORF type:complete len:321 (+),score=41.76 GILJ01000390.1:37-999(+)